jgi:nitroreductase
LIGSAVRAPSAVKEQPWTFTVVREQSALDRISDAAKAHMLATMVASPHAEHFAALLNDPSFHIFYHAPVLILISASAQGPWVVEDCALAAENLMLVACAQGLGSCWMICAELPQLARGQEHVVHPPSMGAYCTDHCRASSNRAAGGSSP